MDEVCLCPRTLQFFCSKRGSSRSARRTTVSVIAIYGLPLWGKVEDPRNGVKGSDRLRWMRCACAREPSNFFVANATRPIPTSNDRLRHRERSAAIRLYFFCRERGSSRSDLCVNHIFVWNAARPIPTSNKNLRHRDLWPSPLGKGDRLRWMRCACAREPSNFFVANATRPVPHVERPSPSSRAKRRDLPLFSKIA